MLTLECKHQMLNDGQPLTTKAKNTNIKYLVFVHHDI